VTAVLPALVSNTAVGREQLLSRLSLRLRVSMVTPNMIGGATVLLYLNYVLPFPKRLSGADQHHVQVVNFVAFVSYLAASAVAGTAISHAKFKPIGRWLRAGGVAEDSMRRYVLRHPLRQTAINASLWLFAAAVFVPINIPYGATDAVGVGLGIVLGGMTTCGITYFIAERLMRPLTEVALAGRAIPDPYVPGVKSRLVIAWVLCTGIPLLAIGDVLLVHTGRLQAAPILYLVIIAFVAGLIATVFASRSVAEPVESVTRALAQVEDGRLDVSVAVYDGSEVGRLQSGFNAMVTGLGERARLRELFGRQVGEDVATQAFEHGVDFEGRTLHAAVLFVDVIGSTELALSRRPSEVVAILNAFFAVVVDVVARTGGFVNKFEGDAALCIYGAPTPLPDAESCALLAARMMRDQLLEVPHLVAGIGVSAGVVVAGNVGTASRYEYTVLGDAVNEAARLTELAKDRPGRVLAAASAVAAASTDERAHWCLQGEQVLRGRAAPTGLAVPA
jgi:adenylate cyclase